MQKLILILGATIGSILTAYLVRVAASARASGTAGAGGARGASATTEARLLSVSRAFKLSAFFLFQPITYVSTFWNMNVSEVPLVIFPVLGLISVVVSGGVSLVVVRLLALPPERGAAVFCAGLFTNVLTFGGLVGFGFFGEYGYLLAQLFATFIATSYYLLGYPVSRNIARDMRPYLRIDPRMLREHPFLIVPVAAMALGLLLNLLGIPRPAFLTPVVAVNVPLVAVLLGSAIGLSLRVSRIRAYRREVLIIVAIKFLLVPALMIPLGLLTGLPGVAGGIPFRMLIVLSTMPVAFNALVPPAIFGFDLDLANSAWIVTTASLLVTVPLLYVLLL